MKKVITILLSFLLMIAVLPACAEETGVTGEFGTALRTWSSRLPLSDWAGKIDYCGYPYIDATFRNDSEISELAINGLGRIQFSDKALAMEISGQQYYVDLDSMTGMMRSMVEGKQALKEDIRSFLPWITKAYQQILLPCISVSGGQNGLMLHFRATGEELVERTRALIDEIMEERTWVEGLLKRYGPVISQYIPNLPLTYEGLAAVWETEKSRPALQMGDFLINADIMLSPGSKGGLEMTCDAEITSGGSSSAILRIAALSAADSKDLVLSVRTVSYWDTTDVLNLEYHSTADNLQFRIASQGSFISLNASKEEQKEGNEYYLAELTSGRGSYLYIKYKLEAWLNETQSTLKAVLAEIRDPETSYETSNQLAGLEVYGRARGWDAVLTMSGDTTLTGRMTYGEQYTRFELEKSSRYGIQSNYADLWIYHMAPDDCRIKLDTDMLYGRTVFELTVRRDEFGLDITQGFTKLIHIRAVHTPTAEGFKAEVEFLSYSMNRNDPVVFHLGKNGRNWSADVRLRVSYDTYLDTNAALNLGTGGEIMGLEANMVISSTHKDDKRMIRRFTYVPGTLTYLDETGLYELKVTEDSAQRMVLCLIKDFRKKLGDFTLTLDENDRLDGTLAWDGQDMVRISIEPVDKAPIREITKDDSIVIDEKSLQQLISSMSR